MASPRLSCAHLFCFAVLVILANGCASLQSATVEDTSKLCAHSGRIEGTSHTPRSIRTQIARSFSGGSPSAATRVVWITREDTCL